jgi:hypothetical protein
VTAKMCGCKWQESVATAGVTLHEFPIRDAAIISTKFLTTKITLNRAILYEMSHVRKKPCLWRRGNPIVQAQKVLLCPASFNKDCSLLGRDAVQHSRNVPMFLNNLILHLQGKILC